MSEDILHKWRNEMEGILKKAGEPVGPSQKYLQDRWHSILAHSPPRSVFYVEDMTSLEIRHRKGFEWIGYDEEEVFQIRDLTRMIPDFQKAIILHQVLGTYRVLDKWSLQKPSTDGFLGLYYSAIRAITDANGKNWLALQTSEPWQYDSQHKIVSYLNWLHILAPYEGQGVRIDFYHHEPKKYAHEVGKLNNMLQLEKQKLLEELGFTHQQKEIIKGLYLGRSTKAIAKEWEISVAGVRYHYGRIKNTLEEFFKRSFRTTEEAVVYLTSQQILV